MAQSDILMEPKPIVDCTRFRYPADDQLLICLFCQPDIIVVCTVSICCVKSGADDDAAIENWYDNYLLSYKNFFSRKMISKMRSENLWLMHFLESRCGIAANVTLLKLTWNEQPDEAV